VAQDLTDILLDPLPDFIQRVSRIVAFIVKNINTKILFACLVG
jgi:hypothetical protein